jgi:lipid-binding SYLF domain-containing protein
MKKYLVAASCLTLIAGVVYAKHLNNEQKRLEQCGVVMQEVLNVPDNIPHELLEKAECVIVIPSVRKLAFGVGASYGRGAMVCSSGGAAALTMGQTARPDDPQSLAHVEAAKKIAGDDAWLNDRLMNRSSAR